LLLLEFLLPSRKRRLFTDFSLFKKWATQRES
jgi:hypothetical protein